MLANWNLASGAVWATMESIVIVSTAIYLFQRVFKKIDKKDMVSQKIHEKLNIFLFRDGKWIEEKIEIKYLNNNTTAYSRRTYRIN